MVNSSADISPFDRYINLAEGKTPSPEGSASAAGGQEQPFVVPIDSRLQALNTLEGIAKVIKGREGAANSPQLQQQLNRINGVLNKVKEEIEKSPFKLPPLPATAKYIDGLDDAGIKKLVEEYEKRVTRAAQQVFGAAGQAEQALSDAFKNYVTILQGVISSDKNWAQTNIALFNKEKSLEQKLLKGKEFLRRIDEDIKKLPKKRSVFTKFEKTNENEHESQILLGSKVTKEAREKLEECLGMRSVKPLPALSSTAAAATATAPFTEAATNLRGKCLYGMELILYAFKKEQIPEGKTFQLKDGSVRLSYGADGTLHLQKAEDAEDAKGGTSARSISLLLIEPLGPWYIKVNGQNCMGIGSDSQQETLKQALSWIEEIRGIYNDRAAKLINKCLYGMELISYAFKKKQIPEGKTFQLKDGSVRLSYGADGTLHLQKAEDARQGTSARSVSFSSNPSSIKVNGQDCGDTASISQQETLEKALSWIREIHDNYGNEIFRVGSDELQEKVTELMQYIRDNQAYLSGGDWIVTNKKDSFGQDTFYIQKSTALEPTESRMSISLSGAMTIEGSTEDALAKGELEKALVWASEIKAFIEQRIAGGKQPNAALAAAAAAAASTTTTTAGATTTTTNAAAAATQQSTTAAVEEDEKRVKAAAAENFEFLGFEKINQGTLIGKFEKAILDKLWLYGTDREKEPLKAGKFLKELSEGAAEMNAHSAFIWPKNKEGEGLYNAIWIVHEGLKEEKKPKDIKDSVDSWHKEQESQRARIVGGRFAEVEEGRKLVFEVLEEILQKTPISTNATAASASSAAAAVTGTAFTAAATTAQPAAQQVDLRNDKTKKEMSTINGNSGRSLLGNYINQVEKNLFLPAGTGSEFPMGSSGQRLDPMRLHALETLKKIAAAISGTANSPGAGITENNPQLKQELNRINKMLEKARADEQLKAVESELKTEKGETYVPSSFGPVPISNIGGLRDEEIQSLVAAENRFAGVAQQVFDASTPSATATAAAAAAANTSAAPGSKEKEGAAAPAAAITAQPATQKAALSEGMEIATELGFKAEDFQSKPILARFAEGFIDSLWFHSGHKNFPKGGFLKEMVQGSSGGRYMNASSKLPATLWAEASDGTKYEGKTYYEAMSIVRNHLVEKGEKQNDIGEIQLSLQRFLDKSPLLGDGKKTRQDAYNLVLKVLNVVAASKGKHGPS